MATKPLPSPEVLRQLLSYDPDTGKLFWKERGPEWFPNGSQPESWNKRLAGAEAFTALNADGYKTGSLFNRSLRAHRVIWAMVSGGWPEGMIDHANGDRTDNRLENLRLATNAQNQSNKGPKRGSLSGLKGVTWDASKGKWRARISHGNRRACLGLHETAADAHRAYRSASKEYHGDFGRAD